MQLKPIIQTRGLGTRASSDAHHDRAAITPVTNVRNRTILIVTQYRQLNEMTVEQLWDLHQEVAAQLTRKVTLEKAKWEERLRRVSTVSHLVSEDVKQERRPYPKVLAKYRNP